MRQWIVHQIFQQDTSQWRVQVLNVWRRAQCIKALWVAGEKTCMSVNVSGCIFFLTAEPGKNSCRNFFSLSKWLKFMKPLTHLTSLSVNSPVFYACVRNTALSREVRTSIYATDVVMKRAMMSPWRYWRGEFGIVIIRLRLRSKPRLKPSSESVLHSGEWDPWLFFPK